MNKAVLIGNLARDPEYKTTNSGLAVCSFTLAVNRRFKSADGARDADFIPVVAWRQTADLCAKYLTKGKKCAVIGTIQTRNYLSQDGTKRYVTEVVADEVEFLSSREDARAQGRAEPQPTGYAPKKSEEFDQLGDDELPF